MKAIKTLFAATAVLLSLNASAQVVSDLRIPKDGKIGEFTAWEKKDVSFDDGTKATIEYRIGLADRKGIACHYNIEVKNTSDMKINIKVHYSYYDKLVKGQYGEDVKETLKPGKGVNAICIAQGCKKEKDAPEDRTDYDHCAACDFSASIYISK